MLVVQAKDFFCGMAERAVPDIVQQGGTKHRRPMGGQHRIASLEHAAGRRLGIRADDDGLVKLAVDLDDHGNRGGREAAANLLRVDYEEADIHVQGLISRPGLTRSSRREQRLFVNGRPAGASVLYSALRDTYGSLVMKGRYPPVLLHIDLPPDQVDVNVHPGKKEVRFRNPRQLGEIVSAAVRIVP